MSAGLETKAILGERLFFLRWWRRNGWDLVGRVSREGPSIPRLVGMGRLSLAETGRCQRVDRIRTTLLVNSRIIFGFFGEKCLRLRTPKDRCGRWDKTKLLIKTNFGFGLQNQRQKLRKLTDSISWCKDSTKISFNRTNVYSSFTKMLSFQFFSSENCRKLI